MVDALYLMIVALIGLARSTQFLIWVVGMGFRGVPPPARDSRAILDDPTLTSFEKASEIEYDHGAFEGMPGASHIIGRRPQRVWGCCSEVCRPRS